MNCIDRTELNNFLKMKLTPEQMLAVDEHVTGCAECKAALGKMSARADFGNALVGADDCPEYEELSAYIDNALDGDRSRAIFLHTNLCELCAKDVERIRELRSHAALRDKVVMRPGMNRQPKRSAFGYWKQALAAVTMAGIIAVVVISGKFGAPTVQSPRQIATNPPVVANHAPLPGVKPSVQPVKPAPAPVVVAANPSLAPKVTPVLRDGSYAIIRRGGKMVIAKSDGTVIRSALEAKLDEKLRTGKIKPMRSYQMACATINTRDNENGYDAPPTAPKQTAPMGKVMLSARPTFTWSAVDLAVSYRIRVYDESSNLVVDQTVKKNSFTPVKPLARGKVYKWRVGVRFGETDQWAESAAVTFAVLSNQDLASIKQVQSTLPGSHLALGAAYESVGLYDEAAKEYRALRQQNPNSGLAQKMLRGIAER